jgi:CheY-like chemotaxis protein
MTDRKRIEDLESTERGTNEFLAMLGHELRNPLAPIRNALDVLRSDADEPTKEWSRAVIERQIAQLTRLVDDLLDISRVTSGTISLRKDQVELAAVTERAVESSRPLVEARRHQLEVDLPEEPLWVEGDLVRLSQVVLNLLNNSAKFTPEGGRIDLSVREENGDVLIRVRDTGIGISRDLLPTVFDIFKQGARSLDRSEGGLGLGLTLVRRIVEMHGGSVEARSEGPDRGSEFIIRLPRLVRRRSGTDQPSIRESKRALPGSSRRVLVVDDNVDSAETAAMLLQLWGHEVRSVHDGPSAISLAASFRPEVVLLDIGLPGMDGYDVARRVREIPGLEKVTVMAMTGYGHEGDRRRALEGGFDRYLVKPLEPNVLQRLIASAPSASPDPSEEKP